MSNLKQKLTEKVNDAHSYNALNSDEPTQQKNVINLNDKYVNIPTPAPNSLINSINQSKDRIILIQTFIKEMLIQGVDYGLIPKCEKPCLFKSGAEKLCDVYSFSKTVEVNNRKEDIEKGFFQYEIKVSLFSKITGCIEGEGIGSCNSFERKFKHQDSFSIANTILKMAQKRAFVDAVLSATKTSGFFTQDLEEDDTTNNEIFNNKSISTLSKTKMAEHQQLVQITQVVSQKNIPISTIKDIMLERYNANSSNLLTELQAEDLLTYLKSYKTPKSIKGGTN